MALVLSINTVLGASSSVAVEPDVPDREPATVTAFVAHTAVGHKVTAVIPSIKSLRKDFAFLS
jgi:hypothetical protein